MHRALTIGFLFTFAIVSLIVHIAVALPHNPIVPTHFDPIESSASISDTVTYSTYLPLIARPHPCRIDAPCEQWSEMFDDQASGWLTHTYDLSDTFPYGLDYTGGVYQMDLTPPDYFRALASLSPLTHTANAIVEVSARWTEFDWGTGYGLILGADGPITPTRMYVALVFCLGANDCNWQHAAIWRYDAYDGEHNYTRIAANTVCMPCVNKHSKWNHISATRYGTSITLEINGVSVLEADDNTYIGEGYAGTFVEIFENPKDVHAQFDDMIVYDLGPTLP